MDAALKYFNLGLTILFILLVVGLLLAALIGFFRGVWKSTYRMVFMLGLFALAFITLDAMVDFAGSFPLHWFLKGSIALQRDISGETYTYYVTVTTGKETLAELVKGFYIISNANSVSEASAVRFATAVATSAFKIVIVIVDVLLIVTLGNLFCSLLWLLIFRHLIPVVVRKRVKLRWISLAETVVTFGVISFLFLSPFTAIANSLNQAYQRNDLKNSKSDNEMVQNVGNFVTAYNDSLFAKILFNWSVDQNGMTYDTRLFSDLTNGVSGEFSVNLIKEIVNFSNLADALDGLTTNEEGNTAFNYAEIITREFIDKAFDTVINSGMIQTALPIICELVLNSDLYSDIIPTELLDLSDVDWKEELGYYHQMVDNIFESGAVDGLFTVDEAGHRQMKKLQGEELSTFINDIVCSENFDSILDALKLIDNSKVMSRAIPALLQMMIDDDEGGSLKELLPFSWEELNEFSWGYETYVLVDSLHEIATLDDHFVADLVGLSVNFLGTDASEEKERIINVIANHSDEIRAAVVGEFDASGNLVNVNSRGQTIVFDASGNRIANRHYCLFDMNVVTRALPNVLDRLFDLEILKDVRANMTDEDVNYYRASVAELNTGNVVANYKNEFNNIFEPISALSEDQALLRHFLDGKDFAALMTEEGNIFSIDASHITYLQAAVSKMDKSNVLYCALAPMLKSLISSTDVVNTFNDLGMKASVLYSAITQDMAKPQSQRRLFANLNSLLDRWSDLNTVLSLVNGDGDISISSLKDDSVIDSLKNILYEIVDNPLLNPTPQEGDDFEKNENIYCMLENVLASNPDLNLGIDRPKLRSVTTSGRTWKQEIDAIAGILQFIAIHDVMNASSTFENGLTRTGIDKLLGHTDEDYYIKGLFDAVDQSYLFKTSLGPFLDDMFGDSLNGFLIDQSRHVTFSNITNWSVEGTNIENLLKSLRTIIPENDADAQNFFTNLDITTLTKVVELNSMLHDLANSGIFTYVDENDVTHYQFGKWLYNVIDTSLGSFSVDENEYDLLSDPQFDSSSVDSWDTENWGIRPSDTGVTDPYFLEWENEYNPDGTKTTTHYIAYKDFAYVNGMVDTDPNLHTFWCDYDAFVNAQEAFTGNPYGSEYVAPNEYLTNDWGKYFGSDAFIQAYSDVLEVDEISRVVKFTCYAMRLLQPRTDNTQVPFNEIPKNMMEGMLFSLNETHCMRIGMYNFYRIAADNVFATSSSFSLSSAYFTYMIDVDEPMYDFESARPVRHDELERFASFYDLLLQARERGVISGNNFVFDNIRQNNFLSILEDTLLQVNDSYVFHRKGSSKVNQLTTFQSLLDTLLSESEIGNSIYLGNKSPKDVANASLYNSAASKIRYLVESVFPDDAHNQSGNRTEQHSEIVTLTSTIDKLYSLKDSSNNPTASLTEADLNNDDNIDAIYDVLTILNDSALLCDLVPNSIYKIFVDEPQFDVTVGSEAVDFSRIDPFYHYYYNVETLAKLGTPNFETAKYSDLDIVGIRDLLDNYSAFNSVLNGGSVTDPSILKYLVGSVDVNGFHASGPLSDLLFTLHDSAIFHTPARSYDAGMYYTTKYDSGGYTLFEEMINDIAIGSGLADYAFDSAYDSVSSAAIKLHNNIKEVTKADDGVAANTIYSTGEGEAWNKEINSLMEVAYRVADLSTGSSIDISNISMQDLDPTTAYNALKAINSSDIAGDSIYKIAKDGFDAIGLDSLTSYNAVNYANYRISRIDYGGANAEANAGTEIHNLYNVLSALRDGDHYANNFSNITTFVTQDTTGERMTGLLGFIYESKILNTPVNGTYNSYYSVSGSNISAQGVLLYNVMNNASLADFIDRNAMIGQTSTALEKIEQLSYIVHMPTDDQDAINAGLTYEIESKGLHTLISIVNTNGIDANTFSGAGHEDINTVKSYRNAILQIINAAYDSDGEGHRSALVSEFVSGLLNNVLENEFKGLNAKVTYAYNYFAFGKDLYDTHITYSRYSTLNEKEKNGMQGILDSLDYVSQLNVATLISMSDTDRHQMADDLEACFALMTTDNENSEIARIVYLNNVHNALKLVASVPNRNSQTFTPYLVDETSLSTTPGSRSVYSEDFYFSTYGTALKDFVYPGFF